ncbi:MAG: hypothetical protein WC284_18260 [Candidimonas sp.]
MTMSEQNIRDVVRNKLRHIDHQIHMTWVPSHKERDSLIKTASSLSQKRNKILRKLEENSSHLSVDEFATLTAELKEISNQLDSVIEDDRNILTEIESKSNQIREKENHHYWCQSIDVLTSFNSLAKYANSDELKIFTKIEEMIKNEENFTPLYEDVVNQIRDRVRIS